MGINHLDRYFLRKGKLDDTLPMELIARFEVLFALAHGACVFAMRSHVVDKTLLSIEEFSTTSTLIAGCFCTDRTADNIAFVIIGFYEPSVLLPVAPTYTTQSASIVWSPQVPARCFVCFTTLNIRI